MVFAIVDEDNLIDSDGYLGINPLVYNIQNIVKANGLNSSIIGLFLSPNNYIDSELTIGGINENYTNFIEWFSSSKKKWEITMNTFQIGNISLID